MAHNKLYRNFIILQEDESSHSGSEEKPLSGYAKIEAKSDKCKITFYAQNLKKDEKYSIVLICYRKEIKQIVELGFLEVNEVGKGEAIKEYYINDIAGLNFSYEKISGAAICKHKNESLAYLMYGFMNNENIKEDWKKCKIIKCADLDKKKYNVEKPVKEEHKKECKDDDHKHYDDDKHEDDHKHKHYDDDKHEDDHKHEHYDDDKHEDDHKHENHDDDKHEDDHKHEHCDDNKHEHHDDDKYGEDDDKHEHHDEYKHGDDDHDHHDEKCDKKEEKDDVHHEKKKEEYHKHNEDYECDINCKRGDSEEKDDTITRNNFDEYEAAINKAKENQDIDPYDFNLRGAVGDFFNNIVKGFDEVKDKFKEIKYCKWYKIKINSIDDMCNTTDYNKYTVAYYPMLNYYPYIKKYGYLFIGYKCNSKGDLKYIVYGIPGLKDKDEQPYVGKTGFVTWINSDNESLGCWLMFYDYKNSNIVVPMK